MLTEFVWVTGLVKLLTDASLALYIVLPLLALIVIGWNVVKRLQADVMKKIKYKENMKNDAGLSGYWNDGQWFYHYALKLLPSS